MNTIGHLINGQLVMTAQRMQDVYNPATGEVSKRVALAPKETVEEAITAAQAAFPAWRDTPPIKRARVMFRYKELLEQKETDYFNTIIKLMKKVDTPEKMEEIIAYYTDVPRFYTNKSFQEEIAKALIRFNGHKGIIAEVKRCSKFLDNFEIRRALRETAA